MFMCFLFQGNDSILVKQNEAKGFQNAVSLTLDAKENIYVLDAGSNQVIKFGNNLEFKKRNGKQGWAEGQFETPTFIDGSTGLDLFVTDGRNHRIQRLDLEINPVSALKTDIEDFPSELRFRTPIASLVLNSNELYVIDQDNNRIVVYKDGRNPSYVFGDYKSGKGQLARPVKLLKDAKNFIYVLDKEYNAIVRFDNLGNYVNRIEIEKLENFTIRDNILYLFNGKEIFLYDLNRNSVVDKKIITGSKKYRDLYVLSGEKYLLLGKNALSLWQVKN